MRSYTVHIKGDGDPLNDAIYVQDGFSFWAFFFNFLWLLYQRLWLHTIFFSLMGIGIVELEQGHIINPSALVAVFFLIALYIGYNGKDYLRQRIEREGYKIVDIITANSLDEAGYKFTSKVLASQANTLNTQIT